MSRSHTNVVWIHENPNFFDRQTQQIQDTVKVLQDSPVISTLLYNPTKLYDIQFFKSFHAAFPLLLLEKQLHDIKPDIICFCSWSDASILSQLNTLPVRLIHFDAGNTMMTLKNSKSKQRPHQKKCKHTFDIVLRTKNDQNVIGQTLFGLLSQDVKPTTIHIIDSGSQDDTLKIIKEFDLPAWQIPPEEYFPGKVLNSAIDHLNSDIVVFLNSDAVPLSPKTVSGLLEAFDTPENHAAYARQVPRPDAEPWVVRDYHTAFPSTLPAPEWIPISLPHAAIRRITWLEHPFYTQAWGSEDTEWGVWARQKGLNIQYRPESLVMHSHNYTLKELYGRRFIEGEADAYIYNSSYTPLNAIKDVCKATARDCWTFLNDESFTSILTIPMRRLVYYWGYFKGHKHGTLRKNSGNKDSSFGQK